MEDGSETNGAGPVNGSRARAREAARRAGVAYGGGSSETVALYVWGGLAGVSVLVAAAISYAPGLVEAARPSQTVIAATAPESDTAAAARAERQAAVRLDARPTGTVEPITPPRPPMADLADVDTVAEPAATDVATGADGPSSFGAAIATGRNLERLLGVLQAFATRKPDLFADLSPRLGYRDGEDGLEGRIVAGPFGDADAVAAFCRRVRLELTAPCEPAAFEGEPIPRELLANR